MLEPHIISQESTAESEHLLESALRTELVHERHVVIDYNLDRRASMALRVAKIDTVSIVDDIELSDEYGTHSAHDISFTNPRGRRFAEHLTAFSDIGEGDNIDVAESIDRLAVDRDLTVRLSSSLSVTLEKLSSTGNYGVRFHAGETPGSAMSHESIKQAQEEFLALCDYVRQEDEKDGIYLDQLQEAVRGEDVVHREAELSVLQAEALRMASNNIQMPGLCIELTGLSAESVVDKQEHRQPYVINVRKDRDEAYMTEVDYNGVLRTESKPFIETAAAAEILAAFEKAGIAPAERVGNCFTETGAIEKRYGNGYADFTREIAKHVNDVDRPLSNMFEGVSDREIADKIRLLGAANDPAAAIALDLLRGVVDRNSGQTSSRSLPFSERRVELRDGSCKDIEYYLAGPPSGGRVTGLVDRAGIKMWKSDYAKSTLIALEVVDFNGVELPPGSLFEEDEDGNFVFMRITSFALSEDQALETFGAQESGNRDSGENIYQRNNELMRDYMDSAKTMAEMDKVADAYHFGKNDEENLLRLLTMSADEAMIFIADLNRILLDKNQTQVKSKPLKIVSRESGEITGTFMEPDLRRDCFVEFFGDLQNIISENPSINPQRVGDALAMATVMIHPFHDGNGRTARALSYFFDRDYAERHRSSEEFDAFSRLVQSRDIVRSRVKKNGGGFMIDGHSPEVGDSFDYSDPGQINEYLRDVIQNKDPNRIIYHGPFGEAPFITS